MNKKATFFIGALLLALAVRAYAEHEQRSLAKVIPAASRPFVCHFGAFKVKVVSEDGSDKLVSLEGSGLQVNSTTLGFGVAANREIRSIFKDAKDVVKDSTITAYCSGPGAYDKVQKIERVDFYVVSN
ncbi:MAG: hypothetical protein HY923_07855 [Elusimicrobia bacterium]|nr:hypothetical protein [Elusimicrobiota bacterium]